MKVSIRVVVETDDGAATTVHEVAHLERQTMRPEELGLTPPRPRTYCSRSSR